MATYEELFNLSTERDILVRVATACMVKAEGLITGASPTTAEIIWASNTLSDPMKRAKTLVNYALAVNKDSSAAAIRAATDATFQSNIDIAADKMIAGGVE